MPRRPRHLSHHGPPSTHSPSVHAPRAPVRVDSTGPLRALVEEAIVTAAAINARDDLEIAAASTQRLGALTSGMWRALSRELATAAERLDLSTRDRLSEVQRRAVALHVDVDDVIRAGLAAAHLAEHAETLESLIRPDDDVHRLLGPNMLFGFSIEPVDDDALDESDESAPVSERIAVFLWPAPLSPAAVTMVPSLLTSAGDIESLSEDMGLEASSQLTDALARLTGLPTDGVSQTLSALAVACWTAHHLDENPIDDDDEDAEVGEEDPPSGRDL
jgi:hypothetical protein